MSHRGQSHLKTITRARPVSLKPPIQHLLCIGAWGACTRRLFWRLFFWRLTALVEIHRSTVSTSGFHTKSIIEQQSLDDSYQLYDLYSVCTTEALNVAVRQVQPMYVWPTWCSCTQQSPHWSQLLESSSQSLQVSAYTGSLSFLAISR